MTYLDIKARGAVPNDLKNCLVVHDHYKPYNAIQDVEHVYCNAHILRELKGVSLLDKHPWSLRMFKLLVHMNKATKDKNTSFKNKQRLCKIYDSIIASAIRFYNSLEPLAKRGKKSIEPKRKGHNLALRLLNFKDATLRFLFDKDAPFTNNQAERDLRMTKLKQKISGCFRTNEGANNFALIRSCFSTLTKNGVNILKAIRQALFTPVHLRDFIST